MLRDFEIAHTRLKSYLSFQSFAFSSVSVFKEELQWKTVFMNMYLAHF